MSSEDKILEVSMNGNEEKVQKAMEKARLFLTGFPGLAELAAARALNRAAQAGRTAAVQTVRQDYTIKAATVRKTIGVKKAKRDDLEAGLYSRGSELPLSSYKLVPSKDTTGKHRVQPKVSVKKEGGLKRLGHFVYKGKLLRRLGESSLPVEELKGPAIPQILKNPVVIENIQTTMAETFEKRIEHETNFMLENAAKGKK